METLITWLVGVALAGAVTLPFWRRARRREREAAEREATAAAEGVREPVSLHPVVDPDRCIGSGACVQVCPEHVLAFRDGRAFAVAAARCVGHGLCERACPMEAITLVFGTEKRGVELPRVQGNFESNVPGLFIIGELGGMGLVANAFEQAAQCVAALPAAGRPAEAGSDVLDLIVIGCGPAGLAASLHARARGLRFETLEREPEVGGAVRSYPRRKLVLTREVRIPGGRLPFREISKEELVSAWERLAAEAALPVRTGTTVTGIRRGDDGLFTVLANGDARRARRVILAIGRRGTPRKLGVPGEDASHVAYALREPDDYAGLPVLVVGGGDSAVEAALALAERDCRVTLSYRGDAFARIKPANLERVRRAMDGGAVRVLWNSAVREIRRTAAVVADGSGEREVAAEAVFVFIGGELPTRFLRDAGVAVDVKFGVP